MISRGHKINYPVSPIGGGQIIVVDNDKKYNWDCVILEKMGVIGY